jgi:hypothetical protein
MIRAHLSIDMTAPHPFPKRRLGRLEVPRTDGALARSLKAPPGVNRPEWGRRTQLILPVSNCGTNASVRVDV